MTASVSLTARDQQMLLALVQKVRLLSLRQIAEHWWQDEVANARRRLRALTATSLVQRVTVAARTLPPIDAPVATWQPGHTVPDFGQVSYRLQSRWRRRAVRSTSAYIATDHAAQLFGGKCRAVWLRLHDEAAEWADAWRSEDLLAHTRRGEKLPDGFIVDREGETVWVIEFGGSYDAPRVQEFHEDCADRNLPYQIW